MLDNKYIGVVTVGVEKMGLDILYQIEREFQKEVSKSEDWFYMVEINGQKYFICDNGEQGYTAMLPSEY